MLPAIITLAVLLAIAVGITIWLFSQRSSLQQDRDRLVGELAASQLETVSIEQTSGELREQISTLREKNAKATAQLDGIDDKFKSLANDVLKQTNEQFLELAEQKFKGEQKEATGELEKRKQAIEEMMKPVREALNQYSESVQEVEKERKESYGSIKAQIAALQNGNESLVKETQKLSTALRRPEVRGRWGEMQLRRVAELAGMIPHCDFQEQVHQQTDDGAFKPDMVVHLPSDRNIIIDAKTPIDAYISSVEATDDDERASQLMRHVGQIETQIKHLSSKKYFAQFTDSADFVVLFIPGESFLQAAVQLRPTLIESAMEKGVVIASPSTLIALLKTVALGWREERIAENARKISEAADELHKRMSTMFGHLSNLGKAVDKTIEHYNKFVGSLESQVLVQAKRMEDLGVKSQKELPETLPIIETVPRALKAVTSTKVEPVAEVKQDEVEQHAGPDLLS